MQVNEGVPLLALLQTTGQQKSRRRLLTDILLNVDQTQEA